MNKLLLGACVAALFSGTAHAQQHFTFRAQLDNPSFGNGTVTGAFKGKLSGNLITNLSDISVFVDGVAFKGNGSLYNYSYPGGYFELGTGIVSLDGKENNFQFTDADFLIGGQTTNSFSSIVNLNDFVINSNTGQSAFGLIDFQVVAVPEAATWAMMISGFALTGAMLRRRRISVRYA